MCKDDCVVPLIVHSKMSLALILFILDEDCNIEKGLPGPPGPAGLPGEVGQKGEAVIQSSICSLSFQFPQNWF